MSAIKIVFGCMTFGAEGAEQSRVHSLQDCQTILDVVSKHGHDELDCARMYGGGSSEQYLGKLGVTCPPSKYKVATKCFPSPRFGYTHSAADIARCVQDSLQAMQTDKFDLFYLHSPDRSLPFAETLEAVNKAHQQGKFDRFGLSNFRADEVNQIVQICEEKGWLKPTVYQGLYNAITRSAEPELFPVLRKHSIAYYAYNPLGGGFFTGAYSQDAGVQQGSRFDPDRWQGQMYRKRYWNQTYFDALDVIKPVAEAKGLRLAEIALRWLTHHSILAKEHGDAVIIGASSTNHIEQNLLDLEAGPLDQDVLDAVDKAWETVKPNAPSYHH